LTADEGRARCVRVEKDGFAKADRFVAAGMVAKEAVLREDGIVAAAAAAAGVVKEQTELLLVDPCFTRRERRGAVRASSCGPLLSSSPSPASYTSYRAFSAS